MSTIRRKFHQASSINIELQTCAGLVQNGLVVWIGAGGGWKRIDTKWLYSTGVDHDFSESREHIYTHTHTYSIDSIL